MQRSQSRILILILMVAIALALESHPIGPLEIESVWGSVDAQGNVWLDSPLTIALNKPLTPQEARRSIVLEPPISASWTIRRDGPWFDQRTVITINPDRATVFEEDASYQVRLPEGDTAFAFQTVSMPKAVVASPDGGEANTRRPIVIGFDRPMAETSASLVTIEPPVEVTPHWQGNELVVDHAPLEPATTYQVTVPAEVFDEAGHALGQPISFTFTTAAVPMVVSAEQLGLGLPDDTIVKLVFDQPMDEASVEASFRTEPPSQGWFEWSDPRTMVWHGAALSYRTLYTATVGGVSASRDPLPQQEVLQFQTTCPPAPAVGPSQPVSIPQASNSIILTFDDFGRADQVGSILDTLAAFKVRAIFFPIGSWAAANPALIERMRTEGHIVGNHTYDHANLTTLSDECVRWEIVNGVQGSGLLRPPYGAVDARVEQIAASLGYQVYRWNIDSEDWRATSPQEIVNNVLSTARPGGVVVFHMSAPHTAAALPAVIRGLRAMGFAVGW
jgi:peptidoglycan/xylan/chitin deacetylase (PgdA/CDA1 family)